MRTYWEDEDGRRHAVEVPAGQEFLARQGIPIGPPDLSNLDLPLLWRDIEIRLHNALFERGILTAGDARRHPQKVQQALQYALKIGTHTILNLYDSEDGYGNHLPPDP